MRIFTQATISFFSICLTLFLSFEAWAQCPITVNAGDDIYLCSPPTPTQLDGSIDGDYLSFTWSPLGGLTGANTLSPSVNVTQTTSYVLTAKAVDLSVNTIDNGDFESGNSGFSSNYLFNPGDLWPEGVYDVLTDPSSAHTNFAACGDHTSGTGNMMAINGNAIANQPVWCQSVSVMPNTEYAFTAWATSLVASAPAQLQFSVNGSNLGAIFGVSPALCNWQQFYAIWNSGASSVANICIVNQNTAVSGNDFALDDIGFSPVCVVRDTVTVHVVNVTAVASPTTVFIPCEGSDITLSGVGSSTGPHISYNWDTPNGNIVSGNNTLNPVIDAPGSYTLTVTYDNGNVACTKTATVNVVELPNQLSTWVTPPQPLGCGGTSITLLGNSSQANVSYSWSTLDGFIVSGQMQKNCIVNQVGTYTLLVTNTVTGCTATTDVTVTASNNAPTAVASASGPIDCMQNTATLSGAGSTTGGNISYQWNAILGGNITGPNNALTATVNGPGVYTFSVTNNSNNCITVDTVSVTSNIALPVLSINSPDSFTCALDTVILSGTGSPANLSYTWTTNSGAFSGPTFSPHTSVILPGAYYLTATNLANGCSTTDTVTVINNAIHPSATILQPDSITCQQNTVVLSGNGSSAGASFVYAWNGPGIVSGGATLSPTVNAEGDYILIVTNLANACTDTASVHVFADANAITAVANAPDTLDCVTATLLLNSNGSSSGPGFTYAWSTSNGQISLGSDTPTPTISMPGTYQLLLTNPSNGCTSTDEVVVLEDTNLPIVNITQPDTLTCANPQIGILAHNNANMGNFSYQWSTATGIIVSGGQTLNPQISAPGIYSLMTTNHSNGCTSSTATNVIQEAGLPVVVIAAPDTLKCTSPTLQINASASSSGMQITWSATHGGAILMGQNTLTPTVNQAGTYSLLLTNLSNGCTATGAIDIIDNQVYPPADAGSDGTVTCQFPQFAMTANAAGGNNLNYQWQTPNGTILGNPNSQTIATAVAGTYIALVTDPANGCVARDTVLVVADQVSPPVTVTQPAILTCTTTELPIVLHNALAGYAYNWQTLDGSIIAGNTAASPTVNAPGTYDGTIINPNNGCFTDVSVVVTQNIQAPQLQIATPQILDCNTLTVDLAATTDANVLQWSTANGHFSSSTLTAPTVPVDAPGDYTIVAENTANGCTTTAAISVTQDIVPPMVEAGPSDTLDCQFPVISLNGSASPGAQLTWTASVGQVAAGAATLSPTVDHAATYTLTATNPLNGCSASDQVAIVNDANAPFAVIANTPMLTCILTQTTLQGQGPVGTNFVYSWQATNGGNIVLNGNTLTPLIDHSGNYLLTVSNLSNSCTATASVTVGENILPPVVNAGTGPPITCEVPMPALQGSVSPGSVINWTTLNGQIESGQSGIFPVVSLPGLYTLTATNPANGCTATDDVQVNIDTLHPLLTLTSPNALSCSLEEVPIMATVQNASNSYSFAWITTDGQISSNQFTLMPTVNRSGTYTLRVENMTNGCTTEAQITINQDTVPPVVLASSLSAVTCANPEVAISGAGSSAGTYLWTGPQIISGGTTLSPVVGVAGTYTLSVTAASNGCTGTATTEVLNDQIAPSVAIAQTGLLTCAQAQAPITATVASPAAPGYTFNWGTTNGHFASGQTTLSPIVDMPGFYALTVTNSANGCTATVQTTVNQDIAPPGISAGPDGVLHCQQPQLSLSAAGANNLSYSWMADNTGNIVAGATTSSPTVDAPGIYTLTATDPVNGCTATDTAAITAIPLPQFMYSLEQPDCHSPTGIIEITTITGNISPYSISIDGGLSFSTNKRRDQLSPGDYEVIVRDANGCTATETVRLEPPFFPEVALPSSYYIELGDSVQLVPATNPPATAIAIWEWSPDNLLSCPDCHTPFAKPFFTTEYTLTITDANGCTAVARTRVEVDRRRRIFAPNVFTPAGADNTRFMIFGRGIVEIESLQVFDRWGAKVWQGAHLLPNDIDAGWDGTVRGKGANPAVYVWQAVIVFPDGEKEVYSGDISVLR